VDDQSVLVATKIKDNPVVADEVDGVAELPLDLARIGPMCLRCNRKPGADGALSLRVTRPEFPQRATMSPIW
jgi:hypothetical protein